MFIVFINENPIFLTDSLKNQSKINFYRFNNIDIQVLIDKLKISEISNLYLYNEDVNLLFEKFKSTFKVIKAAGGIVKNSKNKTLFIYRSDKWDLPKGKIEKKETIERAAIREVEEETGVIGLEIIKPLETTYHIYKHKNEYVLKITYWFEMKTSFTGKLLPQLEEGITKVEWLNQERIKEVMKNTYANIKLLIDKES